MSKKTKSLLLLSVLMAQSPGAVAGYYNSSIEGISVDGVYENKSPIDVSRIVCEEYKHGSQYKKEHLDMCNEGVIAAHTMAQKYAQGEGSYLGCIDGYQQGLYKGYSYASNPSAAQLDQARKLLAQTQMKSASVRGAKKAKEESRFSTEGEIIKRFRDNVRTSSADEINAPSRDYSQVLKIPRFEGYNDGYSYDNQGGSFNDVVSAGWISSNSSIRKRIEARAVARQYGIRGNLSEMCSSAPVLFNKSLHTVSIWDIFSAYGEYNFKDYGWKSTTRSWNKFAGSNSNDALRFKNIQSIKKEERYISGYQQKAVVKKIDGVEARDAQGNIIIEQIDDKSRPVYSTRVVTVPGSSKSDLQAVYKSAFAGAYQNLARDYFGKSFVAEHNKTRKLGEAAGKAIGTIVAKETATQEAYNAKYRKDSAVAFAKRYKDGFVASWNSNYNYFANNPMIEVIPSLKVIGQDEDGIFRRDERVRPILKLRNLGLAKGKVDVEISGNGVNSRSAIEDKISAPASLEFSYNTNKFLGKLDGGLGVLNRATITVSVEGPKTDKVFTLKNSVSGDILINEIAEIHAITKKQISVVDGSGAIYMTLKNPSTEATPANIDIKLSLKNGRNYTTSAMTLNAGQVKNNFPVAFDQLDPLEIILDNGVRGTVSTLIGDKVLHTKEVNINVGKKPSLAKYYSSILTNSTENFGDEDREDRIESLRTYIIGVAESDLNYKIKWRDMRAVRQTMIGHLQQVYRSAMAAGKLTEEAKTEYKLLAQDLERLWKGISGYKDYVEQLKIFNGEIETRGKKDRK